MTFDPGQDFSGVKINRVTDKKVIICALFFIQFVVYSMRDPVVYRNGNKLVFC